MQLSRVPGAALIGGALVVGLAWGVNARAWMRFISDAPEFSWSGTLSIVFGFGFVGLTQGAALFARRATLSRVPETGLRVLGVVGLLPLFMAAGGLLFPTVIGGGLVVARRSWPRPVRAAVALIALLPVGVVAGHVADDFGWGARTLAGVLWLAVIYGGIVAVVSGCTFAPRPRLWGVPMPVKVAAGLGLPVLLVLATGGVR